MQEVQPTSHFQLMAAVSANPLSPGLHLVRLRSLPAYLRALPAAASQGLLLSMASTLGLLLLALVQRLLLVTLRMRLLLMARTLGLLLAPGQLQTLTLTGTASAKQSFRHTISQQDWRPAC